MNVTRTITVNLTKEEVAEIIKNHLNKEGFAVDAENIVFELSSKWCGYGMDEHKVEEFSGCSVTCKFKAEIK